MTNRLTPCPSCARHVMISEASCPFCREPLSIRASSLDPIRRPARHLGRAAIFAFGTAAAVGCGSSHTTSDSGPEVHADAGYDAGGVVAAYGAPIDAGELDLGDAGPRDAGSADQDAAVDDDAGMDAGNVVAAYGGPFLLDGGIAPPYGIPPDPDDR